MFRRKAYLRLAYFSPLNPVRSGISDYSEELLPYLGRHATIDIFVDGYIPSNKDITGMFEVFNASDFERLQQERRYDTQIYQMGNSLAHAYLYETLCNYPGVTVLHDYVLHHMVASMTAGNGQPSRYVREMGFSHGLKGAQAAADAIASNRYPLLEFSVNGRVLEASLGVIVQNRYQLGMATKERPTVRIAQVNQHAFPLHLPSAESAKEILSLDDSDLVLGSFGFVTPEKRLEVALSAFKELIEHFPTAIFVIIGEVPEWYPLQTIIDDLGLSQSVRLVGRVEMFMFQLYMAATDICVNLRYPTMGETSASLLRILGAGRPAIVSNIGWFAELPDDCCRKIDVGEGELENLTATILAMANNPLEREHLGKEARAYVEREHSIEKSATEYIKFIESMLAQ